MKFLITGSQSFLGRHLQWYLNDLNHFCGLIDGKEGVDITDYNRVREIFTLFKPDVVYHLEERTTPESSEENPEEDMNVNILGTINVVRCMIEKNVNVMVYVSTEQCANPDTNFAVSKLAAEEYIKKYTRKGKIQGKIARISSIYGPDNITTDGKWIGPVNQFLAQGMHGEDIIVRGDGSEMADHTLVHDVVRALEVIRYHGEIGKTYNVGTGYMHTLSDIANVAKILSGSNILYPDKKAQSYPKRRLDVSELFKLGFVPRADLLIGMDYCYHQMPNVEAMYKKETRKVTVEQ